MLKLSNIKKCQHLTKFIRLVGQKDQVCPTIKVLNLGTFLKFGTFSKNVGHFLKFSEIEDVFFKFGTF